VQDVSGALSTAASQHPIKMKAEEDNPQARDEEGKLKNGVKSFWHFQRAVAAVDVEDVQSA